MLLCLELNWFDLWYSFSVLGLLSSFHILFLCPMETFTAHVSSRVPDSRTRLSQLSLNTYQTSNLSIPAPQQPEHSPDIPFTQDQTAKGESREDADKRGSLAMHARYAIACEIFSFLFIFFFFLSLSITYQGHHPQLPRSIAGSSSSLPTHSWNLVHPCTRSMNSCWLALISSISEPSLSCSTLSLW